jgi:hypothetical protein
MSKKWVMRWNVYIAERPIRPGVWRRRDGGFLVRGKAMNPRTGRRKEIKKVYLDTEDPDVAQLRLREELQTLRQGASPEARTLPRFSEYAASLLERKLASREIKSGKSVEVWGTVLETHLIPAFGELRVDQITKLDIEEWKSKMGRLVHKREYAPTTVNNLLKYLRVILNAACADYELDRNLAHRRRGPEFPRQGARPLSATFRVRRARICDGSPAVSHSAAPSTGTDA